MVAQNKPHMLFVDDEEGIRLTLPKIVGKHGFHVKAVSSVPHALSEINDRRFDVLLSDLNINDEADGLLVIASMRVSQPQCRNFVLTGYPSFETAQQGIRQSIDGYFTKPADVDDLVSEIKARLDRHKA
jgi:ActR/RegA family two-component response regulator